jgi:undecaprenyl phosphate-alpha-L-ara4N flippase subunit ArnE
MKNTRDPATDPTTGAAGESGRPSTPPPPPPAKLSAIVPLFAALLAMDTGVDMIQKTASNLAAPAGGDYAYYLSLLTHPWVWAAVAITPLQLWTWTRILARVDLSLAYPVTSLGTPLTMICAVILLHERLPWPVWLGAGFVTAGVIVMGSTHRE